MGHARFPYQRHFINSRLSLSDGINTQIKKLKFTHVMKTETGDEDSHLFQELKLNVYT
jgi:hypothetical protein